MPFLLSGILIGYFLLLWGISWYISKGKGDNDTFFRGKRSSPWYLVAFGMIGASISGVSFVSVPGYVGSAQMTYLQMCLGFSVGYFIVAFLLLPIYYRLKLTSIYGFLRQRLGEVSQRTGASFFILSKLVGAGSRLYIACLILQQFIFTPLGIPYLFTICLLLGLVWLYTQKAGVKVLVYTDTLQTFCMIGALVALLFFVMQKMDVGVGNVWEVLQQSGYGKIFEWHDVFSKQYFFKQFLSGIFIVIVMTGLDQDMMQKNLSIAKLKDAQKDMCTYGLAFFPINFLFLLLGVLLYLYAQKEGITLPSKPDELLPSFFLKGYFGIMALVFFTLGIVSAAFSSLDSALTALTTSFCVDILNIEEREISEKKAKKIRQKVHVSLVLLFVGITWLFDTFNNNSIIDTLYTLASYTYGPLLGLFAFSIFTNYRLKDKYVPWIAIASPLICYALSVVIPYYTGYYWGYELLLLNGIITFFGLYCLKIPAKV